MGGMLHFTLRDLGGVPVPPSVFDAVVRIAETLEAEHVPSGVQEAIDWIFAERPDLAEVTLTRDEIAMLLALALAADGQMRKPLMFKMERNGL